MRIISVILLSLFTTLSFGAVKKKTEGPWFLVVSSSPQYPYYSTESSCQKAKLARINLDAVKKTSGTTTYYCRQGTTVEFGPNVSAPMCTAPKPAAETQVATCAAPTIGTYGQIKDWTAAPYPVCWTKESEWRNVDDPARVCVQPSTDPVRSAILSWQSPTQNTDGSSLTNLAGFRIYRSTNRDTVGAASPVTVPANVNRYIFETLPVGTHYFGVAAYNSNGAQSSLSAVAEKTIR